MKPSPVLRERLEIEPGLVEARAKANARARYAYSSRQWRTPRSTAFNLALTALLAAIPLIPGGQDLAKVPPTASLGAFGVVAASTLLAAVVLARRGPWSPRYTLLTTLEAVSWCGANVLLIAWSGSASSFYWVALGALIVVTATTIHRHHVLFRALSAAFGLLVGAFCWQRAWGDAALSAVLGGALLSFQRLATITGWRAERAHARSELLAERAGELLMEQERSRIARELHDGVAAELTSVLWQAQALDATDSPAVDELVRGVRASIAELRATMRATRPQRMSAERLAQECRRVSQTLIGDAVDFSFDTQLRDPEQLLSPALCTNMIRVVQEAVRNALRHGNPGQVRVTLRVDDTLTLTIEDDGEGCEPGRLGQGGTGHILERAHALEGTATWTTPASGGTCVSVRVGV